MSRRKTGDGDNANPPVATRQREDGFWEVSGVRGYFREEDAHRVAQQVGDAVADGNHRPDPGSEEF